MDAAPNKVATFRLARVGEETALTALVMRSVREHWNYPVEFMDWSPEDISIEAHHITGSITYVIEVDERVIGVYVLRGLAPEMELSRMMIEPDMIGLGYGRLLWNHVVETARSLGVQTLTIDGDPNAEGFYRRMGAITVDEHNWSPPMMPDWHVKRMEYSILPETNP